MPFTMIVTDAGRAALVNAANTGTAPVTIAQVGLTGTAVTPDVTSTNLPGEFKRIATLSGDVVADDTIHLIVQDETADVFTVRSLALYLGDGTLFAIYGQADVLVEKSAQALMLLAIDVQFADIDAAALMFGDANFLNPPATTSQQGVVELATTAEAQAGIDALRALTPAAAKAAILGWLLAQDGSGSGLDADLLDGYQGSAYVRAAVQNTFKSTQFFDVTGEQIVCKYAGVSSPSLIMRADGSNFYLLLSDAGTEPSNSFNSLRPFVVNLATGAVEMRNGLNVLSSLTHSGNTVWHAGNDGSGSGLDADLLDGQDWTFYTNIPARLGYTPVRQGGGIGQGTNTVYIGWSGSRLKATVDATDQGNLVTDSWLAGGSLGINGASMWRGAYNLWGPDNDGAGSGLDADLLDGQHGTFYTDIPGRLGFTPVSKSGDSYTNVLSFIDASSQSIAARSTSTPLEVRGNGTGPAVMTFHRPGSFASYLGIDSDNKLKFGGWSSGAVAYDVWHSGNDGSGSGLDADLLDGYQASALAKVADFAADHSATGYQKLTGGLVMQWGRINLTTRPGYGVVTFPIAFSGAPFYVDSGCATEVGNADAQGNGPLPYGASATNMNVYNAAPGGGNAWWIAIGKV